MSRLYPPTHVTFDDWVFWHIQRSEGPQSDDDSDYVNIDIAIPADKIEPLRVAAHLRDLTVPEFIQVTTWAALWAYDPHATRKALMGEP